jgi:hypothetical protein
MAQQTSFRRSLVLFTGFYIAFSLNGQSPVREMRVQLASGFSSAEGRLLTAGDTIIFMDDSRPQASFYTSRAQINQITAGQGDAVTIHFKQPVRDRDGERMRVEFRLSPEDRDALRMWFNQGTAASTGVSPEGGGSRAATSDVLKTYSARRDKFIGSDSGQLIAKQDRLVFESANTGASREWLFSDIKRFRQKGPYRLEIQPFSGDKYELELLGGGGMAADDYKKIVDSIARARTKR